MSVFNVVFSCREALDLLGEDLEGTLPPGKNLALRLHLFLCKNCRDYRRTYRTTTELVKALQKETPSDASTAVPDELIRRILAERPGDVPHQES